MHQGDTVQTIAGSNRCSPREDMISQGHKNFSNARSRSRRKLLLLKL
ncbi:predicted protein [Botrytis cinerea T4]|uniref:Uncharacterized protein n=1 Tax=Botryotinia fuckeliana (strain T4) TaxID=999810 RepID=G2XSB7_BOTF4|nr:predicted protein [Botrytis cinerea T4]